MRITNKGSAAFSYEWNLGKEMRLAVKPAAGEMAAGQQTLCCLTFAPRSEKHRLHSVPISCRVGSSKHYNLLLTGLSVPWYPFVPSTPNSLKPHDQFYSMNTVPKLAANFA